MKLRLVLLFTLIAIASHFYLSNHYYELALGASGGDALCNVNQVFNCDTASASKFAQVFDIPIAAFGVMANVILLLLVFAWLIGWSEKLKLHAYFTFAFASFIALVSVVMGVISVAFLGQYCLFCMLTYIMSFLNFELLRRSLKEVDDDPDVKSLSSALSILFKPSFLKIYASMMLAIPAGAFLLNQSLLNQYGGKNLQEAIAYSVGDWMTAKPLNFDVEPSFKLGPDNSKFVIKEFADFRCGHCKHASPSISAFIKAHPDAQLHFYNFPLDGACNDGIPANGISCFLAASVHCAEELGSKGYEMHKKIFDKQEDYIRNGLSKIKEDIKVEANSLSLESEKLLTCAESDATLNAIREQASLGRRVNVRGTPTFYVNGKRLQRAQSLPVLKKAYQSIQ